MGIVNRMTITLVIVTLASVSVLLFQYYEGTIWDVKFVPQPAEVEVEPSEEGGVAVALEFRILDRFERVLRHFIAVCRKNWNLYYLETSKKLENSSISWQ